MTIINPEALLAIAVNGKAETVARASEGVDDLIDTSSSSLPNKKKYHLGSLTKSVTALLVAVLKERGLLDWTSTIGDVLVKYDCGDWKDTNLLELGQHKSGLPANLPYPSGGLTTPLQDRETVVRQMLQLKRNKEKGVHSYSNLGFILLGHICEVLVGVDYETLVAREIWNPLGMTDCGWGPPPGPLYGTRWVLGFLPVATTQDNPQCVNSAGRMHATEADIARYLAFQLSDSEPRKSTVVSNESLRFLHENGLGWVVMERSWASEHPPAADNSEKGTIGSSTVFWHNGSNCFWYATIWIAPNRHTAFFTVSNRGNGQKQVDNMTVKLIKELGFLES